jgi:hypothetical protein
MNSDFTIVVCNKNDPHRFPLFLLFSADYQLKGWAIVGASRFQMADVWAVRDRWAHGLYTVLRDQERTDAIKAGRYHGLPV